MIVFIYETVTSGTKWMYKVSFTLLLPYFPTSPSTHMWSIWVWDHFFSWDKTPFNSSSPLPLPPFFSSYFPLPGHEGQLALSSSPHEGSSATLAAHTADVPWLCRYSAAWSHAEEMKNQREGQHHDSETAIKDLRHERRPNLIKPRRLCCVHLMLHNMCWGNKIQRAGQHHSILWFWNSFYRSLTEGPVW